MKKISLKNVNFSEIKKLDNLELKNVMGGVERASIIVGSHGFCMSNNDCGYFNYEGNFNTGPCVDNNCRYY